MHTCTITGGGVIKEVFITLDGEVLDPSNLMDLQVYYEPTVQQVTAEFSYVKDGQLQRWHIGNPDDTLDLRLSWVDVEADQTVNAISNGKQLRLSYGDQEVFLEARLVIQVLADVSNIQATKCFAAPKKKEATV